MLQTALRSELGTLQQRLLQTEKDLETAKATTATSAPSGDASANGQEEQLAINQRVDAIQKEKDDYVEVRDSRSTRKHC